MSRQVIDKSELIERIADQTGYNRVALNSIVDRIIFEIIRHVRDGDSVRFIGFGKFESRFQESRKVKSPRTGEDIMTQSKYVPYFSPSTKFKKAVNS